MKTIRAMQCRMDEDLTNLTLFLRSQGIAHRITEERGEQVVWTLNEADAERVRALYAEGVPGMRVIRPAATQQGAGGVPWLVLARRLPVTLAVLLVTLLVALYTGLGSNIEAVVQFTFTPLLVDTGYLASEPDMTQWWRLISPMLLHFGWMHLAFNALWYWELGRRIELRSGSFVLLGLTLLFALVSNVTQWLTGDANALFGGLSGVLYGLLGYCWLYQMISPNVYFDLPKGVVIMMLVWLGLCLSGLVTVLGFGAIANGAHVGGLLIGCLCGAVAAGVQRLSGR